MANPSNRPPRQPNRRPADLDKGFWDEGFWFAPKRFGIGSGLPVAWQGWAATAAYLMVIAGSALLARTELVASIAVTLVATAIFAVIAARKTKGGWRWRNGRG